MKFGRPGSALFRHGLLSGVVDRGNSVKTAKADRTCIVFERRFVYRGINPRDSRDRYLKGIKRDHVWELLAGQATSMVVAALLWAANRLFALQGLSSFLLGYGMKILFTACHFSTQL